MINFKGSNNMKNIKNETYDTRELSDSGKAFLIHYRAASPMRRFLVRLILWLCKVFMLRDDKREVGETVTN